MQRVSSIWRRQTRSKVDRYVVVCFILFNERILFAAVVNVSLWLATSQTESLINC
jgi:hypothetical protein